ncbi:hypothetical protein [Marinomonas sp. 2405UD68-3]|uniref:hypothetical protein n=1 Tax=Marinomonas sp. 2405UD68-3 TaxID=3391835 RepID=UPI0039C91D1B
MIRLRLGIAILTLFISACSTQTVNKESTGEGVQEKTEVIQDTQPTKVPVIDTKTTDLQTIQNTVQKIPSPNLDEVNNNRLQLLKDIRNDLASRLSQEIHYLKYRMKATNEAFDTRILSQLTDSMDEVKIKADIEALHDLKAQIKQEMTQLEQRIHQRKTSPEKADLIQIYLSESTVTDKNKTYKTLPLVGEWTRGESRTIHVKDRQLFNSQFSEDIMISFSEEYALIINEQKVMQVDLHSTKKSAPFNIKSLNKEADISGKIDYKIK